MITLGQFDNSPSKSGSRSSSTDTGSNGTVEINHRGHLEWGILDTESESDGSNSGGHFPGCCSSQSVLSDDGITARNIQPMSPDCERDGNATTSSTLRGAERTDRFLQHDVSLAGQDGPVTMHICGPSPLHPSLTLTAPNIAAVVSPRRLRDNTIEPNSPADALAIRKRQASEASGIDGGSPQDSSKLWLRRNISSGRYSLTNVPSSAALASLKYSNFDMTSEICAVPAMEKEGVMVVRYSACLSFIWAGGVQSSKRASLEIVITHARLTDQTVHLGLGDSSVLLSSQHGLPLEEPGRPATITITRHTLDVKEPFNIYLTVFYSLTEDEAAVCVPSFRPLSGTVRSERVFVEEPRIPLFMQPSMQELGSTWSIIAQNGQGTVFDRIAPLPRLFPEAFVDYIIVRFRRLQPVKFASFEGLDLASATVCNLAMTVGKVFGPDIYCDLRLDLALGQSRTLLIVAAYGWTPIYCLLNGQPARMESNQWLKDENGRYLLCKQPYMEHGQAMEVELRWQISVKDIYAGSTMLSLPCIIDRRILCGRLTCQLHAATIKLENPGSVAQFQTFSNNTIILPVLNPDYLLSLELGDNSTDYALHSFSDAISSSSDRNGRGRVKWADQYNSDMHPSISEPVAHGLIHAYDGPLEDIPENRSIDDESSSDHSSAPFERPCPNPVILHESAVEPLHRTWMDWSKRLFRWMVYLGLLVLAARSVPNSVVPGRSQPLRRPGETPTAWGTCSQWTKWSFPKECCSSDARVRHVRPDKEKEKGPEYAATVKDGDGAEAVRDRIAATQSAGIHEGTMRQGRPEHGDQDLGNGNRDSYRDRVDRFIGWAWLAYNE
ncbi:MAG: hypothetical protein Q9163_005487 [Psora crenata]